MANIDEQSEYKTQYWFCGVCKVTEECSIYTTMIYHKHASSSVILQPLTKQAYAELKTVVSKVKKVRKRDAVRASKAIHGLTAQEIDQKYGGIQYTPTPPVDAVSKTHVNIPTYKATPSDPLAQIPVVCICSIAPGGTQMVHNECPIHKPF